MPCHDVERAVVLGALEEFASQLVDNLPRLLGDLVFGHGSQEVTRVRETVGTQRSQFRKFELASPDLSDVSSRRPVGKLDSEANTTWDHDDLTRLDEERPEFGLDIEGTLLWNDKELAVGVDERLLDHACVGDIDVVSDTFTKGWVTRACDGLQAGNEIDFFGFGDINGVPGQLSWRDMDFRVQWEEIRFHVRVVGEIRLANNQH